MKFLDESGFCLWSPVSYTYCPIGQQKVLQQTTRRGRRLSILGFYSQGISFEYGLKLGSFNRDSYLKLMHWQAEKAQARYAATGMITVIVQIIIRFILVGRLAPSGNSGKKKAIYFSYPNILLK